MRGRYYFVCGGNRCASVGVKPVKWLDDIKESAAAFKDWGRILTIIGFIIAGSLVVIAIELFVICLKI